MNLKFSGLGAEPKKVIALGVLVVLGIVAYFWSRTPDGGGTAATPVVRTGTGAAEPVPLQKLPTRPVSRSRGTQRGQSNFTEFHPSLKPRKEGEVDRASIDPTLKLDLLERLQDVKIEGGARSLFEYSTAPPPSVAAAKIKEPPKVIPGGIYGPPAPPKETAAIKPVEPPPPPIPLKFYGFIAPIKAGTKRAFFLDGEDIIVAQEGQTVKNRYKIVRIGVNSAVVEDTQFKNRQQTLPLVEEQTG